MAYYQTIEIPISGMDCLILVDQILVDIGKPEDRILRHAAGCELSVMEARGFGLGMSAHVSQPIK